MDDALRAIAEPHRREILRIIWDRELPAGDIAGRFDITRPAISQHLGVLKSAGLVAERRRGVQRLYRARRERLAELRQFLNDYWEVRLSALKEAAEADSTGIEHR